VLDPDYEGMTSTERKVAEYLNELNLRWIFEAPVFLYDNEDRPRVWTPDFYLPSLGMHIEVWNMEEKSPEYREKAYKRNGYNVIFVHAFKEENQWKNFLVSRITSIEQKRHSEVMTMLLEKSLK
jgi:hypothetical protein